MPHYRTAFRQAARLALQADPTFGSFTLLSAWAENIDADTLPVIAVATPKETKEIVTFGSSQRTTQLHVIAKRRGGDDLEDQLDADSIEIERIVIGALWSDTTPCSLQETDIRVEGQQQRVGTLMMTFTILTWPIDPIG